MLILQGTLEKLTDCELDKIDQPGPASTGFLLTPLLTAGRRSGWLRDVALEGRETRGLRPGAYKNAGSGRRGDSGLCAVGFRPPEQRRINGTLPGAPGSCVFRALNGCDPVRRTGAAARDALQPEGLLHGAPARPPHDHRAVREPHASNAPCSSAAPP